MFAVSRLVHNGFPWLTCNDSTVLIVTKDPVVSDITLKEQWDVDSKLYFPGLYTCFFCDLR